MSNNNQSDQVEPDRRNELALFRTDLANERTLLAYGRTALMMAGTGGTLIKFFGDSRDMLLLGFLLLALGAVVFVIGAIRFFQMKKKISGRGHIVRNIT
ncbi:DUF202 domain-containing protein [Aporhodopirellula aestuarii]|uniref:DUF202 domain-containing protein n=1 Tax=Aporhodopirellula aestuarii TaxID=2950107 RepID=A0ABT0U557_9BACT|nr:DUF202 domain-containing protein [Aporhodopirellula aestuarii]MCM2371695.1 DUF202 domain-containing protein [Aporhodopirellula aestuarii]